MNWVYSAETRNEEITAAGLMYDNLTKTPTATYEYIMHNIRCNYYL